MGDSVSIPQPITTPLPPNDATVLEAVGTPDTDALWGEFNKFYIKNEKAIEKCMKTDVRSIALGEKASDIELQIDTFSETTKVVLDVLAGLGKIHPVIGAAVVAFHAVISLDLSRRDNDRKVIAIMVEMQNMMCGMFQLRHLKHTHPREGERDAEKRGLHRLIENITADIMQCGSDLNYYLDQKFAFKLIKAKNFEQRFKTHLEKFARRRSELQNTVAVYIAGGVGQANVTISAVSAKLDTLEAKLDEFLAAFLRKLDTPQEKEAFRFFEQNNGVENCISKDELLDRLLTMTGDVLPDSENKAGLKPDERIKKSRKLLTDEVQLDFEESLKQNTFRFEKLLAIQNNNHERVITQLQKQEGYHKATVSKLDKLLYYMYPDTNLNDSEVQHIWERMGLKTSVKAKTFVLTFRDHYQHDQSAPLTLNPTVAASLPQFNGTTASPSEDPNAWLLEYIDVAHVRPIVEAIDTDGSGFISVKEINTFARARPTEWSLLEWMVYWAAGWHINITQYRSKIYDILIQMHELSPLLHPANRVAVNRYLDSPSIATIEATIRCTKSVAEGQHSQTTALAHYYADSQESALRANLKEVSYIISSVADATLVAGPARAESWIYPLLYLLLERHLAVLKLGMTQVFHENEIFTHWLSLDYVVEVFEQRMESVKAIFSQIYQNIAGHFETFAYGMFYASYKKDTEVQPLKDTLLKMRTKRSTRELILGMQNKSQEAAVPPDTTVLALGKGTPFEFEDLNVYESATVKTDLDPMSHPLEGYWSMVCLYSELRLFPDLGLFHFILAVAPDGSVTGSGEAFVGKLHLTGTAAPSDAGSSAYSLQLKMVVDDIFGEVDVDYLFHGTHNVERDAVKGTWERVLRRQESTPEASAEDIAYTAQEGDDPDVTMQKSPSQLTFSMKRTPADMHRFRCYLSLDTETDPSILAKSRWKFAIEATRFQVQIKNFSSEYVRARFVERRLWLDLGVAYWSERLPADRKKLMNTLMGVYAPWQSRLYEAIAGYLYVRDYEFKTGWKIWCDYCTNEIVCNRYRCITCIKDDMSNQIDRCTDIPGCIENASSAPLFDFVHTLSHTLLRSTSWLHKADMPSFLPHCRTRSENIKKRFRALEEDKKAAKKIAKSSRSVKSGHNLQIQEAINIQPLYCVCCEKEVSLPCWICATCATDTAVCLECERMRARVVKFDNWVTVHSRDHHLLRISDSAEVQSREVNNARLQRELANITTDLRSLEQKLTTHLRAASKVNTVLRKFTSDGEVIRVSAVGNIPGAPVVDREGGMTAAAAAQDTVNEEDDDEVSNTFGSTYSDDTEPEADDIPDTLPSAGPQPPSPVDADAEIGEQVDSVTESSSEGDVHPILQENSVEQEIPVTVLPIVAEASIITPAPTDSQFFDFGSFTSEPAHSGSGDVDTDLSDMRHGDTLVLVPEQAPAAISGELSAPTSSESHRFEHYLVSIDTRISSLETHVSSLGTHIDTRITSLTTHTDARISALDNRLSGLESQLGEILSLLKQLQSPS